MGSKSKGYHTQLVRRWAMILGLATCSASCNGPPKAEPAELPGYDELKFGQDFLTAISRGGISQFSPYSLSKCRSHLALRGCVARPANNIDARYHLDGVPFGLSLSFNRFDKLTDIELVFERDTMDSPSESVTVRECRTIHERALDWATKTYGSFKTRSKAEPEKQTSAQTIAGTNYSYYSSDGKSFVADARRAFSGGRSIVILSHFIPTEGNSNCRVGISFSDKDSVERWSLSPDEEAAMKRITES